MSKAYKVDRTNGDVPLENDSEVVVYDSIDDAELDLANIEEGQIVGTKDSFDSSAIEEEIKADLDEYAENLMQSYGQAVGSYLTMDDNSATPQGYLLADGRDTTGTADELATKYPLLYAYLGDSNVLPTEFDHSVLGEPENISTSLNHTTTSSYYTVPYDGNIIINWTPANRYKSVYWSDDGTSWTEFVYNLDTSAYQTTTIPVKKGDMLYLRDDVADNVIYARFYKSYKYIKAVSGIETGSTEATEVANAINTIKLLTQPDYDNASQITVDSNNTYTATSDGWIKSYMLIANATATISLQINGFTVAQVSAVYGHHDDWSTSIIPISAGQVVSISGALTSSEFYFIPHK